MNSELNQQRFGGRYWAAPAYLPYVQPPLTDEAVEAAERQLGVKLPAAYLALLRQQNGGYLRGVCGVADCLSGIGPQFPSITADGAWWRPERATAEVWTPDGADQLIPFTGDGHWDMCFDYRRNGVTGEPSVTYVTCESEYEEPVAESFTAYLGLLEDSLAGELRVYGELTAPELAAKLARSLGAPEAAAMGSFDHGYEQWRIELPDSDWIWCCPNLVPAGFYRNGAEVVVTDEMVYRLPEDPACRVLLSVTDGARERCLAAVARLGLKLDPEGKGQ